MARNSTQSLELSVDSYCTFAHIEPYIPRRDIDSTSKPTRKQAMFIVRHVYDEINGLLSILGYSNPVASSSSKAIRVLSRLNALGAAADIESAAYSAGNTTKSEYAEELRKMYQVLWVRLEKGQLTLPDATMESNYQLRRNEKSAYYEFSHDADGNEYDPTFSVDTEW